MSNGAMIKNLRLNFIYNIYTIFCWFVAFIAILANFHKFCGFPQTGY